MNLRKPTYQRLPRFGSAAGVAHVRLPFLELFEKWKGAFLHQALDHLMQGMPISRENDLLDQAGLGSGALSLDQWFQGYNPPQVTLVWTAQHLRRLAERAEDLTLDDGQWRIDASDLDQPARDSTKELENRIRRLATSVADRHGIKQAKVLLETIRRRLQECAATWQSNNPWTSRNNDELLKAAAQLRSYAEPRQGLLVLIPGITQRMSPKRWLSDSQRNHLERRLIPLLTTFAALRFDEEKCKRQRRVVENLLEAPGAPGILDAILAELDAKEQVFDQVVNLVMADVAAPFAAPPNVILLVDRLTTVVNADLKYTLAELYDREALKAGCSSTDFAQRLASQGLTINERSYQPANWSQLSPMVVTEALRKEVDRYLGCHDPQAPVNLQEPKTAFQFAARITPVSPELSGLLKQNLASWVQRSRPFAEVHPLAKAEPQTSAFLYCYQPHRRQYERLLQTKAALANPDSHINKNGNQQTDDSYHLLHPYGATLLQVAMAVPLGGLKELRSWVHQANLRKRSTRQPHLFDGAARPEFRLLPLRPEDSTDSNLLFAAALKADLLFPYDGQPPRFSLRTADPKLNLLFAQESTVPEWKIEDFFLELIRSSESRHALESAFPALPSLGSVLRTLADEQDAHKICVALVELGVMESGAAEGQFRLHPRAFPDVLPPGLFQEQIGPCRGLTRDEFIGRLRADDNLYNAVFWRVSDALDLGRLSPNDVPVFLRQMWQAL